MRAAAVGMDSSESDSSGPLAGVLGDALEVLGGQDDDALCRVPNKNELADLDWKDLGKKFAGVLEA